MKRDDGSITRLARSGDPVLLISGRASASLVDPKREAEQWLGSIEKTLLQALASSTGSKEAKMRVILLGVGSGYHVAALLRRLRSSAHTNWTLVAVDPIESALHFCRENVLQDLDWQIDLALNKGENLIPKRNDLVLRHRFSQMFSVETFRNIEHHLIGRSVDSIEQHLSGRPELSEAIELNLLRGSTSHQNAALSVKNLIQSWAQSKQNSEARTIFRVLEELIK